MIDLKLPEGWARTRVDRVATVAARIGWKALTASEYVDEGYIFLSTPNIKHASINFHNVNYITEFRYQESPELALRPGDVLLVKDGNTLGITNIVTELPRPATVNGSIAVLRPFNVEPRFLRYSLDGSLVQGLIDAVKAGMGVPHLFQFDINRLPCASSVERGAAGYRRLPRHRDGPHRCPHRPEGSVVGQNLGAMASGTGNDVQDQQWPSF